MADLDDKTNTAPLTTDTPAEPATDVRRRRARRQRTPPGRRPAPRRRPDHARPDGQALEHAPACARIADDNRGKDILLLDLRQATPLVDFFVIATADLAAAEPRDRRARSTRR